MTGPRTGINWMNLPFADPPADSRAREFVAWSRSYLTHPHPGLGRPGPVCPFAAPAIAHRHLWAAFVDSRNSPYTDNDDDAMTPLVDDMYELFVTLTGRRPGKVPHALVTVFEGLNDNAVIDAAQARHKTRFVEHGFMLGQFYDGCPQEGLWNRDFRPLSTPLSMLVARNMMTTDLPFLLEHREWVRAYLDTFAPKLPSALRATLADDIHASGETGITHSHRHLIGDDPAQ
ncbi:hypothetical protein G4X40_11910 [Rhodococcus sp. D2-41]|uniref:DUF6875 domain-containing protein n=1 Tax=Speluncibacter jeojiensis TaxID=2710754 RepID=A0A9X4LWS0_9ACTN|nr:hypothetical protein [Rhodococcus sp. D2-41]MDG3010854.1 hypothetical protein [Rhodococcus sp. D2-41]MDG3013828.1 hypothetical protein [Corynebacteriales bacterium D3-21]